MVRSILVSISIGWAFECPKCGTYTSSGSNCVPKPQFDTCNCDEPKVHPPKIKLKKND